MGNKEKLRPGDWVDKKATIPKEEVANWLDSLKKGGFTQEEAIDIVLRLTPKLKDVDIEKKFEEFRLIFEEENKRKMTEKEEQEYRDFIKKLFK